MAQLKKELSLVTAIFYGVGIILGAGIYVLIGQGAAVAGNALWLSFVVAAVIASFTAMSYAELAGMLPKTAAEYVYTKKAFGKEWLAFAVQWIMIFALIISATTVALGFGGYFSYLFGINQVWAAAGLLIVLSLISYTGIKESVRFNILATIIEMIGLLIVIILGIGFIGTVDYFAAPAGMTSILMATALLFFAYIGFEEVVNLSEETKNASKVIPKALLISIAITTVLYILVAISAVSIMPAGELAKAKAPLTEVVSRVMPQAGSIMTVIALFATSNTVLAILVVASRMLYGLARNNVLPKLLAKLGKSRTPYVSVFLVMLVSLAFLQFGAIGTVALLTDIGIFAVYLFINAAVIWLRYKEPKAKRTFKSPLNIGRFPALAGLGIVSSLLMLLHFESVLIFYEILVVLAGFLIYKAFRFMAGK
ncbi:MAG: amino acid permease [Candidatus Aenigmarchaeota archaeon]|nr:amino acid permease [Candidatus Aenigmarchaeota archaeon]